MNSDADSSSDCCDIDEDMAAVLEAIAVWQAGDRGVTLANAFAIVRGAVGAGEEDASLPSD